jgi:hypothetical protein
LRDNSGTTGIVLDGISGKIMSDTICDKDWSNCKITSQLITGSALSGYLTGTNTFLTWDIWKWCIMSWSTWEISCSKDEPGNSLWNLSGWNIYYNTWNVGIGTTNPQYKLDVNGSSRFSWGLSINWNVGINKLSPTYPLDLGSNNSWLTIRLVIWGTDNTVVIADKTNDTNVLQIDNNTSRNIIFDSNNSWYNIWIGTTNPSYKLDVNGSWHFVGDVLALAFLYNSDIRLKQDITVIDSALDKILALNGYQFVWRKNWSNDIWVIAQEVEQQFPNLVVNDADWFKAVKYPNLVAPIIQAIKEFYAKYIVQEKKIYDLEQTVLELKDTVEKLETKIDSLD